MTTRTEVANERHTGRKMRTKVREQAKAEHEACPRKRALKQRPPRGPTADELEAKERLEQTKRQHNVKYGYTSGALLEEGWGGPLNLTLIILINMSATYREEKACEITNNIPDTIKSYTGWDPEKSRESTFLLQSTVREMYKLIAEGMPDVTQEEPNEQLKVDRRHRQKLDKIADRIREELRDKTYMTKIEAKRITTDNP